MRLPRVGPRVCVLPQVVAEGLAREFHDRLRRRVRAAQGRDVEPTAAIIDSQSVKGAASVPAASRGFDGGKKINGRRRHVITDSLLGLLLMVLVTAGNITDRQAARVLLPQLHTVQEDHPRVGAG